MITHFAANEDCELTIGIWWYFGKVVSITTTKAVLYIDLQIAFLERVLGVSAYARAKVFETPARQHQVWSACGRFGFVPGSIGIPTLTGIVVDQDCVLGCFTPVDNSVVDRFGGAFQA